MGVSYFEYHLKGIIGEFAFRSISATRARGIVAERAKDHLLMISVKCANKSFWAGLPSGKAHRNN
jgi:hypothetical protein